MNPKISAIAFGALLFARCIPAEAQQPAKIPRIGHLNPGSSDEATGVVREPFERGLKDLGWSTGSNIVVEYRYAEGRIERLPELARQMVDSKIDVIVARGPQAIRAAQKATATIPIVMSSAADPVADGFVKSLASPGGNVTGLSNLSWELDGKRLEMLQQAVPSLKRVAALGNPKGTCYLKDMPALTAVATSLGIEFKPFEAGAPQELAKAFAAIKRANINAVLVRTDALVLEPNREQVIALAMKHRLPAMYPWTYYVEIAA